MKRLTVQALHGINLVDGECSSIHYSGGETIYGGVIGEAIERLAAQDE